jgi:hypothetical protein
VVAGKEACHPLSPHVQSPKWPLVITLKVSGLLHLFGPPEMLHKAISSQPTWGGYPTVDYSNLDSDWCQRCVVDARVRYPMTLMVWVRSWPRSR